MENQVESTQEQVVAPTSGDTEDLKRRLDELEKAKNGILEDLKNEREKRQRYEEELSRRPLPSVAVNQTEVKHVEEDPSAFVTDLATSGRRAVRDTVAPMLKPLMESNARLEATLEEERAANWLAKQEKRDADEIKSDAELVKRLQGTMSKYGINKGSLTANVQTAYALMKRDEKEDADAKAAAEASRNRAISDNATTAVVSNPPASQNVSGKMWKQSELAKIAQGPDYDKYRDELLLAWQQGRVIKGQ